MESLDTMLPYLVRYSYAGLYGLIIACSFGFPFSKTLLILGGGVLASQDVGTLYVYMLMGLAGLVTADSIYFGIGYLGGEKALRWKIFSGPKKQERIREAEDRFRRHEWLAVFSARFFPFVRNFVFVVAGFSRMSPLRFFQADLLSACLMVPPVCLLGYLFYENVHQVGHYLVRGEGILAILFCLVVVLMFVVPRKSKTAKPQDQK